nr:uncharacterized protein LOC123282371 isoform X1 [Equus asinus]XP_044619393.1 uncharacterized protein LOC123282444 isoform X1 [Equus asinus]
MRVASWLELAPRIVWRSVHIGVPWPRALTLRTVPPLSVTGSCEDDVSCSQVLTTCLISQVQTKEEPLPPASSQSIPTFYFPRGRPQGTVNVDAVIAKIERTFAQFPHERATMEDMGKVAKVRVSWTSYVNRSIPCVAFCVCLLSLSTQPDPGDTGGSAPGPHNKVNVTIKQVTRIVWFPSADKS